MFKTLFSLYYRIILNEHKKMFLSKNTLVAILATVLSSLFFIAFGYFSGFIVTYSKSHPELTEIIPRLKQSITLLPIGFIIIKIIIPSRFLKQLNLNNLRLFPVKHYMIFIFDIIVSLFDIRYFFIAVLFIAFNVGTGSLFTSIPISFTLIIIIFFIVLIIHLVIEFIQSAIKLSGAFSKYKIVTIILITTVVLIKYNYKFLEIANNNIFSWNINALFSLALFDKVKGLNAVIMWDAIYFVIGLMLVVYVKLLHVFIIISHKSKKILISQEKPVTLIKLLYFLPDKILPYIEKDIKYLTRSSRSIMPIFLEILTPCIIYYFHFHSMQPLNTIYYAIGFTIVLPILIWDTYLNNIWGFEKKGFGLYLFSTADYYQMLLSKNLSCLFIRLPIALLIGISLSFLFAERFIYVFLVLYFILNLVHITFANIVSIGSPSPIDLKENVFSQSQASNFSTVGLIGLLIFFAVFLLFALIIYKYGIGQIFYNISLTIFFTSIIIYNRMLQYSSSLLYKQKEIIYKKLIRI